MLRQVGESERQNRSGVMEKITTAICFLIVLIFLSVFGLSIYRYDFWTETLYSNVDAALESCEVSVVGSSTIEYPGRSKFRNFRTMKVPHSYSAVGEAFPVNEKYRHVRFVCSLDISDLPESKGNYYLHLGTFESERSRVFIDGEFVFSPRKIDHTVIPIRKIDPAKKEMLIVAEGSSEAKASIGFFSKARVVLASGRFLNLKLLGTLKELETTRPLFSLLPSLTLAFILILGWAFGARSRLVPFALLFLFWTVSAQALLLVVDLTPWEPMRNYFLQRALEMGAAFCFLAFGMELLRIKTRWTNSVVFAGFLVATTAAYFVFNSKELFVQWPRMLSIGISLVSYNFLAVSGWIALRLSTPNNKVESAQKVVNTVFVIGCVPLALCSGVDAGYLIAQANYPNLSHYAMLAMPFFLGGVVLYTLALIEQSYHLEKEQRAKVEGELTLAAKIQNLLLPDALEGTINGWCYRIESVAHSILGGDWVKVHTSSRGSLIIIGDVVGKGASAALTHSGIAAVWEGEIADWDGGNISTEELLEKINCTMNELYGGEMNTTYAVAEISPEGEIRVASGGNSWIALGGKPRAIPGRGSLIGMKKEFRIEFEEQSVSPGEWLLCYTDGVLDGTRAQRKFVREMRSSEGELSADQILNALKSAGEDSVHPDDASVLLLRRDQLAKNPVAS